MPVDPVLQGPTSPSLFLPPGQQPNRPPQGLPPIPGPYTTWQDAAASIMPLAMAAEGPIGIGSAALAELMQARRVANNQPTTTGNVIASAPVPAGMGILSGVPSAVGRMVDMFNPNVHQGAYAPLMAAADLVAPQLTSKLGAVNKSSSSLESIAARIKQAAQKIDPDAWERGIPISSHNLKAALPDVSPTDFDKAAILLRKNQEVTLPTHFDPNIEPDPNKLIRVEDRIGELSGQPQASYAMGIARRKK